MVTFGHTFAGYSNWGNTQAINQPCLRPAQGNTDGLVARIVLNTGNP